MRKIAFLMSLGLIFMIPWEGVVNLPGLGTATKMLGLGVAAFWVATVVITGQLRKPGLFHMVVFLFMIWSALSVFWSGDANRTMAQLMTWVQMLGFILILWDLYTTESALLAGLQAYVLGAYVAIGSAISSFAAGVTEYATHERFTPGADMNPDGFGFILALGIPVAWYLASTEIPGKLGSVLRLVNYGYIPAAFLGIALSGTRAAIVAALPAMVFGLWSMLRLKTSARLAMTVLLVLAVLLLLPVVQPMKSFQRLGTTGAELSGGDLNGRAVLWREGLASFAERPLLGVGSNMYRSINSEGKVAHNSYLSVLVELGLVGFGLFALALVIAISQAWIQPKWESRFWLALLMVWGIGAATLTWEHRKSTWLFLSLLVAGAALARQRAEARPQLQPDQPAGRLVRQAQ